MSCVYCASSGWIDCKRRVVCVVGSVESRFLAFSRFGDSSEFLCSRPSTGKLGSLLVSVDVRIEFDWFVS